MSKTGHRRNEFRVLFNIFLFYSIIENRKVLKDSCCKNAPHKNSENI